VNNDPKSPTPLHTDSIHGCPVLKRIKISERRDVVVVSTGSPHYPFVCAYHSPGAIEWTGATYYKTCAPALDECHGRAIRWGVTNS
jgi:hypothetical protein